MMTVNEMMQFLAQFDGNAEIVVCDWDNTQAIRVYNGDSLQGEVEWDCED